MNSTIKIEHDIATSFLTGVGKKISACRITQGMSRGKLSKVARIGYGRLYNIELGKIDIDIVTLSKIAYFLKVAPKDLLL